MLIVLAVVLVVIDLTWFAICRSERLPDYRVDTGGSEFWFQDEQNGDLPLTEVPVWSNGKWYFDNKRVADIKEYVCKRPLVADDRCVLEYRLQENASFEDFLQAQKTAEDAGASIMFVTSKPVKIGEKINWDDWFLFHSVTP